MPDLKTQRKEEKKKKNWSVDITKRDIKRERIVVNHNFTFLHLHRAKQFVDAMTNTKDGDVDGVDVLGGEFFNGGVNVIGDLLAIEKRWKRKGIVMCVCVRERERENNERREVVGRKLKNEITRRFENEGGIAVGIGRNLKEI